MLPERTLPPNHGLQPLTRWPPTNKEPDSVWAGTACGIGSTSKSMCPQSDHPPASRRSRPSLCMLGLPPRCWGAAPQRDAHLSTGPTPACPQCTRAELRRGTPSPTIITPAALRLDVSARTFLPLPYNGPNTCPDSSLHCGFSAATLQSQAAVTGSPRKSRSL